MMLGREGRFANRPYGGGDRFPDLRGKNGRSGIDVVAYGDGQDGRPQGSPLREEGDGAA